MNPIYTPSEIKPYSEQELSQIDQGLQIAKQTKGKEVVFVVGERQAGLSTVVNTILEVPLVHTSKQNTDLYERANPSTGGAEMGPPVTTLSSGFYTHKKLSIVDCGGFCEEKNDEVEIRILTSAMSAIENAKKAAFLFVVPHFSIYPEVSNVDAFQSVVKRIHSFFTCPSSDYISLAVVVNNLFQKPDKTTPTSKDLATQLEGALELPTHQQLLCGGPVHETIKRLIENGGQRLIPFDPSQQEHSHNLIMKALFGGIRWMEEPVGKVNFMSSIHTRDRMCKTLDTLNRRLTSELNSLKECSDQIKGLSAKKESFIGLKNAQVEKSKLTTSTSQTIGKSEASSSSDTQATEPDVMIEQIQVKIGNLDGEIALKREALNKLEEEKAFVESKLAFEYNDYKVLKEKNALDYYMNKVGYFIWRLTGYPERYVVKRIYDATVNILHVDVKYPKKNKNQFEYFVSADKKQYTFTYKPIRNMTAEDGIVHAEQAEVYVEFLRGELPEHMRLIKAEGDDIKRLEGCRDKLILEKKTLNEIQKKPTSEQTQEYENNLIRIEEDLTKKQTEFNELRDNLFGKEYDRLWSTSEAFSRLLRDHEIKEESLAKRIKKARELYTTSDHQ